MSEVESENTTQPTEETTAEVSEEVVEEKASEKPECVHPSNTSGYHQKSKDGTCIYCGH